MRRVHIDFVQEGEVCARPIFASNGSVLLGVGIPLTLRFIERLRNMGIETLYIEDYLTSDIFPESMIRDESRKKAINSVYQSMKDLIEVSQTEKRSFAPDIGGNLRKVFEEILYDIKSAKEVLVNLTSLFSTDSYLFNHSVNVASIACVMGIIRGYNHQQLVELGIGALLFDVGMTVFPEEMWQKGTALTSEQRLRLEKHTEEGFNLLRNQHNIPLLSAHCALQHHERMNGEGYPRNLKGDEIHEYARIIAIADVYSALTSPRPYRKGYSPSEAIEYFYASGDELFDYELVKLFCKNVAIYPVASTVRLSSGQIGVVSKVVPGWTHRPELRIIREKDGSAPSSPYEIDLQQEPRVLILGTL